MLSKIDSTAEFLKKQIKSKPRIGIILGTGLGNLARDVENKFEVPYTAIPHFPVSTVEGHEGKLIFGTLAGKQVMVMQGRFHFYEGYSMLEVTFPVRVMKAMGIDTLIVSNAAGGLNPEFKPGDLMMITDHINCMPEHPLRGRNNDLLGPRFVDMSEAYSKELRAKALQIAKEENIDLKQGVYVGTSGPTFETPAEYRFFRTIGGDAVGMSTVPEVIVARHGGMQVFAISVITNVGEYGNECSHKEVQDAALHAQPTLSKLIKLFIEQI